MDIIQKLSVLVVAIIHLGFLYLEMFLWKTPKGQKIFKNDTEFAKRTASLAANQGLYNGFLSAGLIWSLLCLDPFSFQLKLFFLVSIIIAGIFGAVTVSKNIIYYQALPAVIALLLTILSKEY